MITYTIMLSQTISSAATEVLHTQQSDLGDGEREEGAVEVLQTHAAAVSRRWRIGGRDELWPLEAERATKTKTGEVERVRGWGQPRKVGGEGEVCRLTSSRCLHWRYRTRAAPPFLWVVASGRGGGTERARGAAWVAQTKG